MATDLLSVLCIHTATKRGRCLCPWRSRSTRTGATGITVWRDALELLGVKESAKLLKASGLKVVSSCRGGFFVSGDAAARAKAVEENKQILDEASEIGRKPLVVYVCGQPRASSLAEGRKQIQAGLEAILPTREKLGVKLRHRAAPPQVRSRPLGCKHARPGQRHGGRHRFKERRHRLDASSRLVGRAAWRREIACGAKLDALFAFHVCDWLPVPRPADRPRLPGDGGIDVKQIRGQGRPRRFQRA